MANEGAYACRTCASPLDEDGECPFCRAHDRLTYDLALGRVVRASGASAWIRLPNGERVQRRIGHGTGEVQLVDAGGERLAIPNRGRRQRGDA